MPCAAAIASPACWNACQSVAWHAALSPLPQNFVLERRLQRRRRAADSQVLVEEPDPAAGEARRRAVVAALERVQLAPCGPSTGARIASASRGYSASQIAGPAPASALPSRSTSSRLEPLRAPRVEQPRASAPSRALGGVLPCEHVDEQRRQRDDAQVLRGRGVHRRRSRVASVCVCVLRQVAVQHLHAVDRAVGPVVVGRAPARRGLVVPVHEQAGRRVRLERRAGSPTGSPSTRTRPCPWWAGAGRRAGRAAAAGPPSTSRCRLSSA